VVPAGAGNALQPQPQPAVGDAAAGPAAPLSAAQRQGFQTMFEEFAPILIAQGVQKYMEGERARAAAQSNTQIPSPDVVQGRAASGDGVQMPQPGQPTVRDLVQYQGPLPGPPAPSPCPPGTSGTLHAARALGAENGERMFNMYEPKSGMPRMQLLDGQIITLARSNPEELRRYLNRLRVHIQVTMGESCYPSFMPHFLKQDKVMSDLGVAAWVESQLEPHRLPSFQHAKFVEEFVHFVSGEVRSPASMALDDILAGRVKQGDDPVCMYAEKFQSKARLLPGESQMSMCRHYLTGLNAALRGHCRLDDNDREWQNLEHLIAKSKSAEQRWQPERAQPRANAPPMPAQPSRSSQTFKRPKYNVFQGPSSGAGPSRSGNALAIAEPARKVAPPKKDLVFVGVGAKGKIYPERADWIQYYGTVPLSTEVCDVFEYDGNKTIDEIRDELRMFRLCWFCKASRDHQAMHCPLKAKEGQADQAAIAGKGRRRR
jgi:hypothetical protein